MKKNQAPHRIRHSHFLEPDEYECSVCGQRFREERKVCPGCGASLRWTEKDLEWMDEEEEISLILDDD